MARCRRCPCPPRRARPRPVAAIAGDCRERPPFGDEPVVVGLGRGVQEHDPVVGDAGGARRFVRAEQHRRALVDVDVGAHALRVREAHGPVVGRDRADLLGRVRDARPRVRVPGRDRGEPRPQLADGALVLVDAVSELARAARSRTAGTPSSARPRGAPSRSRSRRACRRRSPTGTAGRRPTPSRARRAARAARASACACSRRRRRARRRSRRVWMRVGELVDQQLRAVAADRRHRGRAGRDAELTGEQRARVGVRPRPDGDDGDHVGAVEQRRRRRRCRRRRRGPRRRAARSAVARRPARPAGSSARRRR